MSEDRFFLEQYKQVWEQRRHHVNHIWAIPIIAIGLVTVFVTLIQKELIMKVTLNSWSLCFIIAGLIGFAGLFLRHNFFIKVLGLLLKKLAKDKSPDSDLPQFGDDFNKIKEFRSELHIFEKIGAEFTGTFWWAVVTFSIIYLGLSLFTQLSLYFYLTSITLFGIFVAGLIMHKHYKDKKSIGTNILWWVLIILIFLVEMLLGGLQSELVIFMTVLGLIVYAVIQLLETIHKIEAKHIRAIKIISLALILSGVTSYKCLDLITPPIVKSESFLNSQVNLEYAKGSQGNIYFRTKMDVLKPIDLRIKDTYSHLTYMTDYDLLGKRIVFINYEFGNKDATNKQIADNGLVFTYETRACIFSDEYKKFKKRRDGLDLMRKELGK